MGGKGVENIGGSFRKFSESPRKIEFNAQSTTHKMPQLTKKPIVFFCFALPNDQTRPSHFSQLAHHALVTLNIVREFLFPKNCPGFGHGLILTSVMPMPKAPMNKYNLFPGAKHYIRLTGELWCVQPKSETRRMQQAPHE